jgi:hypothetical protein
MRIRLFLKAQFAFKGFPAQRCCLSRCSVAIWITVSVPTPDRCVFYFCNVGATLLSAFVFIAKAFCRHKHKLLAQALPLMVLICTCSSHAPPGPNTLVDLINTGIAQVMCGCAKLRNCSSDDCCPVASGLAPNPAGLQGTVRSLSSQSFGMFRSETPSTPLQKLALGCWPWNPRCVSKVGKSHSEH